MSPNSTQTFTILVNSIFEYLEANRATSQRSYNSIVIYLYTVSRL